MPLTVSLQRQGPKARLYTVMSASAEIIRISENENAN